MEQYQLVAPHQAVLPPISVIVDVHRLEVKRERVRILEHGVAMPLPVIVCDMYMYNKVYFEYCVRNFLVVTIFKAYKINVLLNILSH